jgi:hypothetical protein
VGENGTRTRRVIYLALHGSYGRCWLLKHAAFRDPKWETRVTLAGAAFTFILLVTYACTCRGAGAMQQQLGRPLRRPSARCWRTHRGDRGPHGGSPSGDRRAPESPRSPPPIRAVHGHDMGMDDAHMGEMMGMSAEEHRHMMEQMGALRSEADRCRPRHRQNFASSCQTTSVVLSS